jgi:predicted metal-dependent hydrolase
MIGWLERDQWEPQLDLDGRVVPITLRRHPTARRLTMRLAPDGSEVRITLPRWAQSREAIAFAHARRDWLAQQLGRIPERIAPLPGGHVLYRGRHLKIDWRADAPRSPAIISDSLRLGGPQARLEVRLRRWLESEALALCDADMREYCATAGLTPGPISLSRAQKRWGSCSDNSRIRINWRLVQAPDFVRRSVVAHEVAHLVHFDHSRAFHALLGNIYEGDITTADRWLREHGRGLYVAFG